MVGDVAMDSAVSTHSRLKAAGTDYYTYGGYEIVSTHSRLKAAGVVDRRRVRHTHGFNTQPPEGGWVGQPHRAQPFYEVSTHSRLKAAGWVF